MPGSSHPSLYILKQKNFMIRKYILISIVLFGMADMAHANSLKPMAGVCLGADIGFTKYTVTGFAETFPPTGIADPQNYPYSSRKRTQIDVGDQKALGRIHIGYGHYWHNNFLTGLELGYQHLIGAHDFLVSNPAQNHEVGIHYSSRFDIGVLIGYSFSLRDVLYTRVGYGTTDVEIAPREVGGIGGAFHNLYGPILGFGYSHMLDAQFGLRIEGTHLAINDSYDNDKNDGEIYDITIRDSQISIGVFYRF